MHAGALPQSTGPQRRFWLTGPVPILLALLVGTAAIVLGPPMKADGPMAVLPVPSAPPPGPTVRGIGCAAMSFIGFHIHAHIEFFEQGHSLPVSADTGHNFDHDCLYWIHAHDTLGIIHIEAPKRIRPTVAQWVAVENRTTYWYEHLGVEAPPGLTRRVWVNERPYSGDPAAIAITQHRDITVEFGPPWVRPKKFNFAMHGL